MIISQDGIQLCTTLIGITDPIKAITRRFPSEWAGWIKAKGPIMGSWTSPCFQERVRDFYQEHGKNAKPRPDSTTLKDRPESSKGNNNNKQPVRKFYMRHKKDAKVNHLSKW